MKWTCEYVGVGLQVGGQLLDPVLAAHLYPGADGRPDRLVGLRLGGGAQGDLLRAPPSGGGRGGNPLLHSLYVLGQIHNHPSLYCNSWGAVIPPAAVRLEVRCHG